MHDLAPCHDSKSTKIFLDCNKIPFHSGITREFAGHESHRNVWNIMKKEIGN